MLLCVGVGGTGHRFSYTFSPYLYDRRFKVNTDHQALTSLLTSKVLSPRLFIFAQKLQTWDIEIIYKPT